MKHLRKVIEGKVYDTSTASLVASHSECSGSFTDIDESLYRTRKGNWFLAGEGGPMTHYAAPVPGNQNASQAGYGIVALSQDEARDWCERHKIDAGTIEEWFTVEEA